jgi:four helix bundle protein
MTPDDLAERLIDFAATVALMMNHLPDTRLARHIEGQLIRSGTSPSPHYEEARAAESRQDFIHKLSICLKELRESRAWLSLIVKTNLLPAARIAPIVAECEALCKIIGSSINTARAKLKAEKAAAKAANERCQMADDQC